MSTRKGLPVSQRAMRANLRAIIGRATGEDVRQGLEWYADAQAFAMTLASRIDGDLERAAAVIAAHSPRTFWSANKLAAMATIERRNMPSGIMRTNAVRAEAALTMGFDGLGNGPKVHAFARNVFGDLSRVTVDVWAFRAAMGDQNVPEGWLARKGAYDEVARAYAAVAEREGLDPAVAQALVWVVIRREGLSAQRSLSAQNRQGAQS
jgi:hypothetical protein